MSGQIGHSKPFYMTVCHGINEKFLLYFVINIGYCFVRAYITNTVLFHNNRGILHDEMVLKFFMNTTAKRHVKG